MADLITHGCTAILVKQATGRTLVPVFVAGTMAPDLFSRLPMLILMHIDRWTDAVPPAFIYGWEVFHQPFGMVLFAGLASLFFASAIRGPVFWNLLGGMALHLGMDLMQGHIGVGYLLFYPLSTYSFELGWMGSEATVRWVPFLVLVTITTVVWSGRRHRTRKTG